MIEQQIRTWDVLNQEILDLLVKGLVLKEVADQLGIGLETVRTHVTHIYQKLHVRSRTEAVVKYLRQGP